MIERLTTTDVDRQTFKSAFHQSCRNIPFWTIQGYGVTFLPSLLGIFGSVIAAFSVLLSCIFAAHSALTLILCVVTLLSLPLQPSANRKDVQPAWVFAAAILSAFNSTVYIGVAYFVGRSANWWGLPLREALRI